jgi:hypothetical protein
LRPAFSGAKHNHRRQGGINGNSNVVEATPGRSGGSIASFTTAPSEKLRQRQDVTSGDEPKETGKDRDREVAAMDRGLGLRRALSDETQSRPFQPLGGEVLHIGWLRTDSDNGKVSRAEGEHDRECLEALLGHYTVARELQEELLNRVERGWSDVTFTLGEGYYCRLQRFSEFDTLTLSGPGSPDDAMDAPVRPWQWMLPEGWLANVPGRVQESGFRDQGLGFRSQGSGFRVQGLRFRDNM